MSSANDSAATSSGAACRAVVSLIDAHCRGTQQQRQQFQQTLVALTAREAGIGDQISAFLGALTTAIGSGRRLEILADGPETTSYLAVGFDLGFDAAYTGQRSWVAEAQAWLSSDAFLKINRSVKLIRLPRFETADWGVSASQHEVPTAPPQIAIAHPPTTNHACHLNRRAADCCHRAAQLSSGAAASPASRGCSEDGMADDVGSSRAKKASCPKRGRPLGWCELS